MNPNPSPVAELRALTDVEVVRLPATQFLGLAPFLRMNIAGVNIAPVCQEILARAKLDIDNANLWMNLAIAMMCLGRRDFGLTIQAQALKLQRVYRLAAKSQPARLRLLMLMAPGDISANTPIECLLESSDIDLIFYYVSAGSPFSAPIPEHDVVMVAVCEADENRDILASLERALAEWPKPVINAPQHIPSTDRNMASVLLQNVSGLLIPPTQRALRSALQAVAEGKARLADLYEGCDFPVILRPVGSHAGRDLKKIACAADVADYLSRVPADYFFVSRFVDYRGGDGLYRKYRIAIINGMPFACHMATSSNWMIHYVNAGMYDNAQKRAEEARFMADFDAFARRHRVALEAINRRTKLDYVCVDCAETAAGELLIFEIDHCMIVHAMDQEHLFPFKQAAMRKVATAFRDFLLRLNTADARMAA